MELQIGDKVEIAVCKDNRDWGYNPAPDGTVVEVVGFNKTSYGYFDNWGQEPGVYLNRFWPIIKLPNGEVIDISYCHLKLICEIKHNRKDDFVSELPETKFYPDDKVKGKNRAGTYLGNVSRIEYMNIDKKRDNGDPWPFYTVELNNSGQMNYEESELELIERGNIWKLLNGIDPVFSSVEEEARFEMRRGRYSEVRNPKNQLYCWEKNEILAAIEDGTAHGMSFQDGLFGSGGRPMAIKFTNESLGKKVAKLTMEGFK